MSEIIMEGVHITVWEMLWNLAMKAEGKDLHLIHVYH